MSLPEAPRTDGIRRIPIQSTSAPRLLPLPRPGVLAVPQAEITSTGIAFDSLDRPLHDLRISVTDRCNFRCGYCMPRSVFDHHHAFLPQADLLHFEEITRATRILAGLGVRKVRLTGGEPLLRKDIERLVAQLAKLRTSDGEPLQLAMTTNGTLLGRKAAALRAAGLQRVTVSLDALDPTRFRQLSDADVDVADVLAGIREAQRVGLGPVKVNMVVQRGVNDDQILPMAEYFRGTGVVLRFIEFMDVGQTNQWRMDQVLPSSEVLARLLAAYPLAPLSATTPGETATRWAYADGQGEIGFISSVTQAFCGDCSRLRLSTDGRLFTCLFATQGHDLRSALRDPAPWDDEAIARSLRQLWSARADRYSQLRKPGTASANDGVMAHGGRVEMSYIGG